MIFLNNTMTQPQQKPTIFYEFISILVCKIIKHSQIRYKTEMKKQWECYYCIKNDIEFDGFVALKIPLKPR